MARRVDRDTALQRMLALRDAAEHMDDIAAYLAQLEADLREAQDQLAEAQRELNLIRASTSWLQLQEGYIPPEAATDGTAAQRVAAERAKERHARRHGTSWLGGRGK